MARVQGIIPPLIFLSCPRVFDYQPPVAKIFRGHGCCDYFLREFEQYIVPVSIHLVYCFHQHSFSVLFPSAFI